MFVMEGGLGGARLLHTLCSVPEVECGRQKGEVPALNAASLNLLLREALQLHVNVNITDAERFHSRAASAAA